MDKLRVMISGGFSLAYHAALPAFERSTGIAVTTLSGASQGTGPKTIRHQLEHGADVDVVILSREGLSELLAAGRIVDGSGKELASVPLGAAVRLGRAKPDVSSLGTFRDALLEARLIVMPGSTSGLFIRDEVFPRLEVTDKVSFKMLARGTDSTAMLAAGEADLALGPTSELIDQPGIAFVGELPASLQLVQVFTAAVVTTSRRREQGGRLIAFLASDRAHAAIRQSGMEPG